MKGYFTSEGGYMHIIMHTNEVRASQLGYRYKLS